MEEGIQELETKISSHLTRSKNSKGIHCPKELKEELLVLFKESGLSIQNFSRKMKLPRPTLHSWICALEKKEKPHFKKVKIDSEDRGFYTLRSPKGYEVDDLSFEDLSRLLDGGLI